jgi:PAS domain S-box-containing protein
VKELEAILTASGYVEPLFDQVPDVVFFVKDLRGRYRMVNSTLVERCGLTSKDQLIGRTTAEVFPPPLGERYLEQDRDVVQSGTPMRRRLELHLYPNRHEGWCLTDKVPLVSINGPVCGVAGISRDLQAPASPTDADGLFHAIELIRSDPSERPSVAEVAARVGLSAYQLNRRLRDLLGITASQLLTTTRIDMASRLLRTTELTVGDIAQRSGYFDQSAFSRQFRQSVGLTPGQYRRRHRGGGG